MKPEAQRIAIAQVFGWTEIRPSTRWEVTDPPDEPFTLCGRLYGDKSQVPDYLTDLNAMHEAVMAQEGHVKWAIFTALTHIVDPKIPAACATASEWAKAFLVTLNIWDETS